MRGGLDTETWGLLRLGWSYLFLGECVHPQFLFLIIQHYTEMEL